MKENIYEALKARIGREPTHQDLRDECERIIGRGKQIYPCQGCGVEMPNYFLKDGKCNGCRNPHLIVEAVTE